MAYYPFWLLLIALSLFASIGGFLWASKHRQFNDQERARYLPLRGEDLRLFIGGERLGRETIAMLAIFALGVTCLAATAAVVVFTSLGGTP